MSTKHDCPDSASANGAGKQILIIAGPNGAGKSTFASEFLPNEADCETFVNADLIAAGLNPFHPSRAAIQAGRLMLDSIHRYVDKGESFAFETTLSGRGYGRWIRPWQERGYRVKLVFLRLESPDVSVARVRLRVSEGGHDIPEQVARRRFEAGWRNFQQVFRDRVDEWAVYDNSTANANFVYVGWKEAAAIQADEARIPAVRPRDPVMAGVEPALRRAAKRAWARAAQHGGKIAVFQDGKLVLLDPADGPPPPQET